MKAVRQDLAVSPRHRGVPTSQVQFLGRLPLLNAPDNAVSSLPKSPDAYAGVGPAPKDFEELQCVRLAAAVTDGAGIFAPGTVGAIVYRHAGGRAYEVEFTSPRQAVLTLRAEEIEPLNG